MGRYVTRMGEMRNTYNFLFEKPDEKRPLGGPRHKWGILLKCILLK
jgi:hypothetical protein